MGQRAREIIVENAAKDLYRQKVEWLAGLAP